MAALAARSQDARSQDCEDFSTQGDVVRIANQPALLADLIQVQIQVRVSKTKSIAEFFELC